MFATICAATAARLPSTASLSLQDATFTTLSNEEVTLRKLDRLQAERDVAVFEAESLRSTSKGHSTLQASSREQLQALQTRLDEKDKELRAAAADLRDCKKAALDAEAAAERAELQSRALGGSIAQLKTDIHSTEEQIQDVLAGTGIAVDASSSAVQQLSSLHAHLTAQQAEVQRLTAELAAAQEQAGGSSEEHDATVADLQAQVADATAQTEHMAARLAKAATEAVQLKERLAEAEAAQEVLHGAEERAKRSEDARAALVAELDTLRASTEAEAGELRAALREREAQLSAVESRLAAAEAKLASTEDTAESSQSSLDALTQDVQRLQQERAALVEKLATAEADSEAAAKAAAAQAQTQLQEQAATHKEEVQLLRSKLLELEQSREELHSTARSEEALLGTLRAGLVRLCGSVGCTHDPSMTVQELLAAVEAAVQDTAESVAAAASSATGKLAGVADGAATAATPEAPALETQDSSSSSASSGARTLLRSVVKNLTKSHEKATRRVLVLQKQLQDATAAADEAAAHARSDISSLHRQVHALRRDDDERAALRAQLDMAQAEVQDAKRSATRAQDDVRHFETKAAELQRAQTRSQEELQELEGQLASAVTEARIYRSDLGQVNEQLQALRAAGASSGSSAAGGAADAAELAQLQRTCDGLRHQLQQERDQSAAQEAELQHNLAEVTRLRHAVTDLQGVVDAQATAGADAYLTQEVDKLNAQLRREVNKAIGSQRLDASAVLHVMDVTQLDAARVVQSLVDANGNVEAATAACLTLD